MFPSDDRLSPWRQAFDDIMFDPDVDVMLGNIGCNGTGDGRGVMLGIGLFGNSSKIFRGFTVELTHVSTSSFAPIDVDASLVKLVLSSNKGADVIGLLQSEATT